MRIPVKVSDEQVREARTAAASGQDDESIATRYGVQGGPITKRAKTSAAIARRVAGLERKVAKLEKAMAALRV